MGVLGGICAEICDCLLLCGVDGDREMIELLLMFSGGMSAWNLVRFGEESAF